MSKTKHKITIVNSKGIKVEVPLYTSKDDLKKRHGQPIYVDKQTLYYPTGEETDKEATSARIKLQNGTVEAILKTGTPEPTEQLISVPSDKAGVSNYTGTFVVPSGVTRIRIALCPACMTKGHHWEDDGEHDYWVDDYYKGTDTTFGSGSSKKSAQTDGKTQKNYFVHGCKKSFDFIKRAYGGTKTGFYSIPNFQFTSIQEENAKNSDYINHFYTGYMNVQPQQRISFSVGGKSGEKNKPETCGFILIAYGVGIEK